MDNTLYKLVTGASEWCSDDEKKYIQRLLKVLLKNTELNGNTLQLGNWHLASHECYALNKHIVV